LLFLSYAEEDREIGGKVAAWFTSQGIELFNWLDPNQRGRQFVREIEAAIGSADAFLALLSPHLLASPWCRRERHLALLRETDLQEQQSDRVFIHVLKVAPTALTDAGFLRGYDWGDVVDKTDPTPELAALTDRIRFHVGDPTAERIVVTHPLADAPANASSVADYPMEFRNRTSELDDVLLSITNFTGPHFWLVTSPPHLGKSWFLQRLKSDPKLVGWKSELVDLRLETPETRTDPDALLARLLGRTSPAADWPTVRREIVKKIANARTGYLCLLDSAELIGQRAAHVLRTRLGEIHDALKENYTDNIRLAVVVASRRDAEWRGVTPAPRMTVLRLSEFDDTVIRRALFDFARQAHKGPFANDLRPVAELVHQVTEGLPALLPRCLQWIQDEEWYELERLNTQGYFEGLVEPYIKDGLLSYDSLFPGTRIAGDDVTDATSELKATVVRRAYKALVPYRLFTQSHLRYHLQYDEEVSEILGRLEWSLEDLWNAVSDSALLLRPLDEPWQEIHPAIRRLLYRYCYATLDSRATAHEDARKFVAVWGEQQLGKEQTIGLIECLWHEAMALRDSDEQEFRRQLVHSATVLSGGLKPSPLYTVDELRQYTSDRMRVDTELADSFMRIKGFFQQLIEIVENPLSPPGDVT
jgi:TIR domain-containing protein